MATNMAAENQQKYLSLSFFYKSVFLYLSLSFFYKSVNSSLEKLKNIKVILYLMQEVFCEY